MTVTLFLAQAAAPVAVGAAADAAHERVEVPSGAEVWLQEEITDRVPGMGLVARFRFVMPALEDVASPRCTQTVVDGRLLPLS